jgi:hypothetical protein
MYIVTAPMLRDPRFAALIKTLECRVVIICVPRDVPRFTAEFKKAEVKKMTGDRQTDEVVVNNALSIELLRDELRPQGEIVVCVSCANAAMRAHILEFVRITRTHCNVRAITTDPSSFEGVCPAVTPAEAAPGPAAPGPAAPAPGAAGGGRRRGRRRGRGGGH